MPRLDEDIGDSLWVNYVRMKLFNMKTCEQAAPTIFDEKTRDYLVRPSAPLGG